MSTVFVDGVYHYDTAHFLAKWTTVAGATVDASPPAGRFGPAQKNGSVNKTVPLASAWTIGCAFNVNNSSFGGEIYAAAQVGIGLLRVDIEADGTISVYAGSTKTPAALIGNSAPFSIHANTWYYIELDYSLSGSSNISISATLHVDGAVRVSGSANSGVNVTSLLHGTAEVNSHFFGAQVSGNTWRKDIYVRDSTTGVTGFAGDVTFRTVFPNGDVTIQWSGTGSPAYAQINENPPDDDSTYREDGTINDADNFDWQDLANTYTIIAVQYLVLAKKTDEGTKTIKQTVGNTGSYEQLSDQWYLNDDYIYYHFCMDKDPATTLAWTVANFNAKRFGYEVIS